MQARQECQLLNFSIIFFFNFVLTNFLVAVLSLTMFLQRICFNHNFDVPIQHIKYIIYIIYIHIQVLISFRYSKSIAPLDSIRCVFCCCYCAFCFFFCISGSSCCFVTTIAKGIKQLNVISSVVAIETKCYVYAMSFLRLCLKFVMLVNKSAYVNKYFHNGISE